MALTETSFKHPRKQYKIHNRKAEIIWIKEIFVTQNDNSTKSPDE